MLIENLIPITEPITFSKLKRAWCWNDDNKGYVKAVEKIIVGIVNVDGELKALSSEGDHIKIYDHASLVNPQEDINYEIVSITYETDEGVKTSRGLMICEIDTDMYVVYSKNRKLKIYKPLLVEYKRIEKII